jgi:parallel beta-helix repeat protein
MKDTSKVFVLLNAWIKRPGNALQVSHRVNRCGLRIGRKLLMKRSFLMFVVGLAWFCATVVASAQTVVQVSGSITNNTTWTSDNVYRVIDDLTVAVGAKLTIVPGTVVKFAKRRAGSQYEEVKLMVQGALWAQGTEADNIYFTSIDDPTVGGGGAGGDGVPDSTDWGWIEFESTSENADCLLEHCVVRYGGNDWYYGYNGGYGNFRNEAAVVRCLGASPTIRNCEFTQCRSGIYVQNSAPLVSRNTFTGIVGVAIEVNLGSTTNLEPVLFANTFDGCPTGIRYTGSTAGSNARIIGNQFSNGQTGLQVTRVGTSVSVYDNQFVNLSSYGIQSTDSAGSVYAQRNWWGASTGPSGAGSGAGVPVSSYVNFTNWWPTALYQTEGIRNVFARRQGMSTKVDVFYDLVGQSGKTYSIGVTVTKTGGEPYIINPAGGSLTGDYGTGVSPGDSKHIVWDSAVGGTGPYTALMRVKLTADVE